MCMHTPKAEGFPTGWQEETTSTTTRAPLNINDSDFEIDKKLVRL